jgi:hypothetical protein
MDIGKNYVIHKCKIYKEQVTVNTGTGTKKASGSQAQ